MKILAVDGIMCPNERSFPPSALTVLWALTSWLTAVSPSSPRGGKWARMSVVHNIIKDLGKGLFALGLDLMPRNIIRDSWDEYFIVNWWLVCCCLEQSRQLCPSFSSRGNLVSFIHTLTYLKLPGNQRIKIFLTDMT